jgi:hypothetical protein
LKLENHSAARLWAEDFQRKNLQLYQAFWDLNARTPKILNTLEKVCFFFQIQAPSYDVLGVTLFILEEKSLKAKKKKTWAQITE